ncbi:hypothetical protein EMCG_04494 [[Emmonsia] crescens]|uniref:Rhodopsin domain-containing protein n=1 Tax=[Emmonsia] crescens TaxID=73230 RepID=A0A0G2HRZ7_9EURO|nr:hypothetical protein EMCG_04494 [Emmonsia crescens UAMH 3008]
MDEQRPHDLTVQIWINERTLLIFIISMTVLGSVILIPTAYLRWKHKRLREVEVAFIVAGYIFFLAYQILLLNIQPIIYRQSLVGLGKMAPYPTILEERRVVVVLTIVSVIIFVTALWCIKISLLFFIRQVIKGLPDETRWWAAIMTYTVVTWIFCFLITLLSCGGPVSLGRQQMLMILPLRLILNLHISRARKIAAAAMFSVGVLCMIAAVIRLVQIGFKTGVTNPNVQWISLWGSLEATTGKSNIYISIIVGCLPTFRFLRKTSKSSVGPYSHKKGSEDTPAGSGEYSVPDIPLNTYKPPNNTRHNHDIISSSMESLTPTSRGTLSAASPREVSARYVV